jgi:putative endonuclease
MVKIAKPWFLYVLRCADDTLYTGISNRLEIRLKNHSSGKGARYTKTRLPVELVISRKIGTHSQAIKREYEFKQKNRQEKIECVEKWLKARTRPKKTPSKNRKPKKPI